MAVKSIHSDEYQELIARLIKARKSKKLTQEQVAEKLDKPQSYIAKYEKCERRLDVIELKAICKIIGIKFQDIV